jgi:hypothetical protein
MWAAIATSWLSAVSVPTAFATTVPFSVGRARIDLRTGRVEITSHEPHRFVMTRAWPQPSECAGSGYGRIEAGVLRGQVERDGAWHEIAIPMQSADSVEWILARGRSLFVAARVGRAIELRAFDAGGTRALWTRTTELAANQCARTRAGFIFAVADGLEVVDAQTGEHAAVRISGWTGSGWLIPVSERVFIAMRETELVAIDIARRRIAWRHTLPTPLRGLTTHANGVAVVFAEDSGVPGEQHFVVRSFDLGSGAPSRAVRLGPPAPSPDVRLLSEGGALYAELVYHRGYRP